MAYVWPVLDPKLHPDVKTFFEVVSWTVWAAFAIDFAIRIALADQRGPYILRHWYDVLLVAIPMLRPMRLLRLLAFVRVLTIHGSLHVCEPTTYAVALPYEPGGA